MPQGLRHVLKMDDLKFFRCPVSVITRASWDLLQLVNDTTSSDGDILQLPCPGSYLDQPERYREAVRIVKTERAAWRRQEAEKKRGH